MTQRPDADTGGHLGTGTPREVVGREQRIGLLSGVPAFAALPPGVLEDLAGVLAEERFEASTVVVAEGETGDRLYLIARGQVEVTAAGPTGPLPLATLERGELFGELALLLPDGRRQATVTALSTLVALSLAAPAFHQLLDTYPEARAACAQAAERVLVVGFLRQAGPFASLDSPRLNALAARLERRVVPAGAVIIRQGEHGDTCFLLRSGRVEVLLEEEGTQERRLGTRGPGTVVGEIALLTTAPRTATVRALEPCSVLVIHRTDLLEALDAIPHVRAYMLDLLQLRHHPCQAPGIRAYHRTTYEGAALTILKDAQRGTYYRLSNEGWFLWQRLDGRHDMRALTLDYLDEFKTFAPPAILDLVGRLAIAGFVTAPDLRPDVIRGQQRPPPVQRLLLRTRRLLEWHVALPNVDAALTRLYRGGIYLLYTRLAQAILFGAAAGGLLAFLTGLGHAHIQGGAGTTTAGGVLLLATIGGLLVSIVAHEAGHAFTTKAFGYEVHRAGVGWYWFSPVAFVDTTDMWLAGRWPRIAVSLAGPYINVLLGSLAALVAWAIPQTSVAALLWPAALASYLLALVNLNPLLEYDGYYVLMDLLDRPNLRSWALAWLGTGLLPALRRPGQLRGHGLKLIYGLASLLYVAVMALLTVILYRLLLQGWLARILPPTLAFALAWVLAALVALLAAAGALGELRGTHRGAGRPGRSGHEISP